MILTAITLAAVAAPFWAAYHALWGAEHYIIPRYTSA